jgi:hypothetical protein
MKYAHPDPRLQILLIFGILLGFSMQQAAITNVDFRLHPVYKDCPSMAEAHFEGVCSSSWAITVATVANDVICSKNTTLYKDVRVSYQNMMECCSKCSIGYANGCYGGNFMEAMDYLVSTGAVTGSRSKDTLATNCKNYKLAECYLNPEYTPACDDMQFDMKASVDMCNKTCTSATPKYEDSIKKIASKQVVTAASTGESYASAMVKEINSNNILITEMIVFEDLYAYKTTEIYTHLYGRSIGTLTVAIIGYGVDNGTNFWLVRVPWGEKYGEKGVIKVQKGTNNCGIESPGNSYYLKAIII